MQTNVTAVKVSVYVLILLCLAGCRHDKLKPEAYLAWINDKDNGLVKSETVGNVKYTVAYRPPAYNRAKAILHGDDTMNAVSQGHAFIIKMEPADGKTPVLAIDAQDKQEPYLRIGYYLSEAQKYIRLVSGKDTFAPASYLYERYYNISPAQSLVAGFDVPGGKAQGMSLIVEDKIFSTGKIKFEFSGQTLNNIPELLTDK